MRKLMAKDTRSDVSAQKVFVNEVKCELKAVLLEHDWLEVETWCGKVFYLDNNHYSNMKEVGAAANHFTDAQCGPYPG